VSSDAENSRGSSVGSGRLPGVEHQFERGRAPMSELTNQEIRLLWRFLRRPRARYDATRAAQLSGVPRRTLYDWASAGVVVPDSYAEKPKMWSGSCR